MHGYIYGPTHAQHCVVQYIMSLYVLLKYGLLYCTCNNSKACIKLRQIFIHFSLFECQLSKMRYLSLTYTHFCE